MVDRNKSGTPFPWPGNKDMVADLIACRLLSGGKVSRYIEPFAGGLAVLLRMPTDVYRICGDRDGVLVNIWRSIRQDPGAVARAADHQVSGVALVAILKDLAKLEDGLLDLLASTREACNPVAAGLRLFCLNVQLNQLRVPKDPGSPGLYTSREHSVRSGRRPTAQNLLLLQDVLRGCKILHGDWLVTLANHCLGLGVSHDSIAIMLDPPYHGGDAAYRDCSGKGEPELADRVGVWARDHATCRIALCGPAGVYDLPGWDVVPWEKHKRLGVMGRSECIWFSPACGRGEVSVESNWLEDLE